MMRQSRTMLAAVAALGLSVPGAQAAGYNIDWTGVAGVTMTGMFSFNDALLGTGPIGGSDLDSLMIEVFLNGASQGSWNLFADGFDTPATQADFNFNFDTTTGTLAQGGVSDGPNGQDWNVETGGTGCTTVGFSSRSDAQTLCLGGNFFGAIPISQANLTATPKPSAPIPLPAAAPLLAGGLAALAMLRRRRRG